MSEGAAATATAAWLLVEEERNAVVRWARLFYKLTRIRSLRRIWAALGSHLRGFAALRDARQ